MLVHTSIGGCQNAIGFLTIFHSPGIIALNNIILYNSGIPKIITLTNLANLTMRRWFPIMFLIIARILTLNEIHARIGETKYDD